jgi:hypothetical protein
MMEIKQKAQQISEATSELTSALFAKIPALFATVVP